MKKLLAIFPLILLTAVLVSPRSAVKATEATIYFNSVPDTIPYANLLAILQAGGSFDLEEYKSQGGTFESFIEGLRDTYGDVLQIPDNLYKKLKEEWQTTRIQQDQSVFLMPWQKENFARQIAYDSKFYQKILDEYNPPDDTPNVYPNPDYNIYLAWMNGQGFDYILSYNNYINNGVNFLAGANLYSYVRMAPLYEYYNIIDWSSSDIYLQSSSILTANIIGSTDNYSVSITSQPIQAFNMDSFYSWGGLNDNAILYGALDTRKYDPAFYTSNNGRVIYISTSGKTLSEIMTLLSNNFRNISINVNGVPWAVAGVVTYNDSLTFDNVIGTNYDDLAYDVVVPVNNDLAFDLTAILQYLYGGFANTFSEAFDFSSLWDIGAIVNADTGEAISSADADTKTKAIPIAKAIEDEATDDAEVTPSITPTPDPDGFPVITITPIPIDNALVGSTILAEIVDATQNALPSQLIDAFWGIVFICFFIGIIWTFHK